jgi:hypothetical protein
MNTRKPCLYSLLATALLLFAVSGAITFVEGKKSGPRPPRKSWQVPQRDVNAMGDCQKRVPGVKGSWDILTGYFIFEGKNSEKYKECLKTRHGWFELGPPEWAKGTMAPPR